jgi:hypothetical protein
MSNSTECKPTTLGGQAYDRTGDSFKSFVYDPQGWCVEAAEPDDIPTVTDMVKKLDARVNKNSKQLEGKTLEDTQENLCNILQKKTCHIVGSPDTWVTDCSGSKHEIQIQCGINREPECVDIRELLNRIQKEPDFAQRFAPDQIMRIEHLHELMEQKKTFPCHRWSRNSAQCKAQVITLQGKQIPKCLYEVSSLMSALLGRRDPRRTIDECYMSPTLIQDIGRECSTIDIGLLKETIVDLLSETFHQQFEREVMGHISMLESYIMKNELLELIKKKEKKIEGSSRAELCAELSAYVKVFIPDKIDVLTRLEGLLTSLGATYISIEFLNDLLNGKLNLGIQQSNLRVMTNLMNIVLLVIENGFISWSGWFLFFPGGVAMLKSLMKDPLQATAFLYSLQLGLDKKTRKQELLFKHLLMLTDTLKIPIPWKAIEQTMGGPFVKAATLVGSQALRKIPWSTVLSTSWKSAAKENVNQGVAIAKESAEQIRDICDKGNEGLF